MENRIFDNYDDLWRAFPNKEFGERGIYVVMRYDWDKDLQKYIALGYEIELEHSCDEWIIGNVRKSKIFLSNLQEAIKFIEDHGEA